MTTAAQRDAAIADLTKTVNAQGSRIATLEAALTDHEARLKKIEQPPVDPPRSFSAAFTSAFA